jgi:hypothetical protein
MPKTTEHFNLVYAAADEVLTADVEEDRYLIIDRQLFGAFEVLGNGVIEGWDVTAGDGLVVIVSSGSGIIDFKYIETTSAVSVFDLGPESTIYLYVEIIGDDPANTVANFFVTEAQLNEGDYLLLAVVTSGSSNITDIDEDMKPKLSYIQAAIDLVKNHRHFGGADNPTQIDLTKEVRGELPASNIADLDAAKITSGRLSESVIPQLSHNDLDDIGTLTHPQIDAFIKMLSFENSHLLGEVSGTNMLQFYLAFKHVWSDVDQFTSNLLTMVPGITPDSFTDFDATNAVYDSTEHVIKGIEAVAGSTLTKTFDDNTDFKSFSYAEGIAFTSSITLDKDPEESVEIINFEEATQDAESIPGFVKTVDVITDGSSFKSTVDGADSGFFGGEVDVTEVVKLAFTNAFGSLQDWTLYDTIDVKIKTLSLEHGQVFFSFFNQDTAGDDIEQTPVSVLSINEVTDGYKIVTIDITTFDRDKVSKIVIATDTSVGWEPAVPFSFTLDKVTLKKSSLYKETGTIRYIISLPQIAEWSAISWTAALNGGTVKFRARTAPISASLSLTPYSDYLALSGDSPDVDNDSNIEIEITLTPSSDRTASPVLTFFKVTYVVASTDNGFIVDSQTDWEKGTPSAKADLTTTPGSVRIKEPLKVDNIYYGNSVIVSELDRNNIPVFGYRGNDAPAAPQQIIDNNLFTEFDLVTSVTRLDSGNYLFCDTGNDRIIELDPDGTFVFGLGSFNEVSTEFTVLSSVYRSDIAYVTVVLTKRVTFDDIDLTKFEIKYGNDSINLDATDTKVEDSFVSTDKTVQIFNIKLSTEHNVVLKAQSDLRLIINDNAFSEEISDSFDISSSLGLNGIPIFKGNFVYMDGIFQPVSVAFLENGNYLIGNAKRWGRENTGLSTVIEVNDSGFTSFSYNANDFVFSLQTLGGVREFSDELFIFSGIVGKASVIKSDTELANTIIAHAGNDTITSYTINKSTTLQLTAEALDDAEEPLNIFGNRFFWTSSNTSVASIDRLGLVTANNVGTASITVTSDEKTATVQIEVKEGEQNPSVSTVDFTETEKDIADNAAGKTIIVDRVSKSVRFTYDSADGLFPSAVAVENDDSYAITEKALTTDQNSRVIKVDSSGNILFDFGLGLIDSPNDVKSLRDDEVIVSS